MASKKVVTASVVREWAREQGLTVGTRGRLDPKVREAFEQAHKGKATYAVGHKEPKTVSVSYSSVSAKGRKTPVTKKVDIAAARSAAQSAGVAVGARGRLTKDVLVAFAQGDFSGLLSAPEASEQAPTESE